MGSEDLFHGRVYLMPICVAIFTTLTLGSIQIICHLNGSVPDWWFCAPFSVAAAGYPQRYVYGSGMTLVALFFSITMYLMFHAFLHRTTEHSFLIKFSIPIIVIAAIGCLVQAWVCLQSNIIEYMDVDKRRKSNSMEIGYTTESLVHTIAAGVFFALAGVFISIISIVIYREDGIVQIISKGSKYTKYVANVLMLMSVVAGFMLHPAVSDEYDHAIYNAGGALQWVCVASLIVYVTSFYADIQEHQKLLMHEYNRGRGQGMDFAAYSKVEKGEASAPNLAVTTSLVKDPVYSEEFA